MLVGQSDGGNFSADIPLPRGLWSVSTYGELTIRDDFVTVGPQVTVMNQAV